MSFFLVEVFPGPGEAPTTKQVVSNYLLNDRMFQVKEQSARRNLRRLNEQQCEIAEKDLIKLRGIHWI